MKKTLMLFCALAITAVAHANSYTLFSNLNCYNGYQCALPVSAIGANQLVTSCTFSFTSVNSPGLLYCDLLGNNSVCTIGNQHGSTTTWNCTLDSNGLNYLNNCISSGNCNFDLNCYGNCNIGRCDITYTCTPTPKTVPDNSLTVGLLGVTLLGLELLRRKLAPAAIRAR